MVTIFIIDKNINTIKSIKKVLKDFSELSCVGTSSNAVKGMNVILKQTPDVVFLNIDTVIGGKPELETPSQFLFCRSLCVLLLDCQYIH